MRLTDPPDNETVQLLKILYDDGRARPPIWQWVCAEATRAGLDADELVNRLPTWKYGYRSVHGAMGRPATAT